MTDQKAEDDIENLENSAKVDSKMKSGGYVHMNPSLTGTSYGNSKVQPIWDTFPTNPLVAI